MLKKAFLLAILSVFAVSCGGDTDEQKMVKVKALQKNDKNLSCRELLLEMNEAQYYEKSARKTRGANLKNMLMPLGYISTYMDSEDAINAAQARVEYLDRIYEIMHCARQEQELEKLPVYQKSGGGKPEPEPEPKPEPEYGGGSGARFYIDKDKE